MSIIIGPMASAEEMEGKAYVHWKAWQKTYTGLLPPAFLSGMTYEKCLMIARKWPDNTLVAKDSGRIIGCVTYSSCRDEELPDTGEIIAIYILSEYYGRKVGYQLMQEALRCLASHRQIALWVLRGNQRAINFYTKSGFRFDGAERPVSPGSASVELRMILRR